MSRAAIREDWVGRVVDGRFPLLQWLSGSERSVVFRTELGGPGSQKAAIKLVLANYVNAQMYVARWKAASGLSHPHLMKLLHTGRSQIDTTGLVYSVTEYADEILSEIVPERALKADEAREMLGPVIDALMYLHVKGFVHGHLKSSNIVAVGNQLKLSVDRLEITGEMWRESRRLTVYDAPEIGVKEMTPAVDVWSLGMTLVEVLTQSMPEWDRESGKEPVIPAGVPEPFARIARECLRIDPAKRCTLADVNRGRMEGARSAVAAPAAEAERAPAPVNKPELVPTPSRRVEALDEEEPRSMQMGVIAGVAAVVVLVVIFLVVHTGSHPAAAPSAIPPGFARTQAASADTAGTNARQAPARRHEKRAEEMTKPQAGVPEAGAMRREPVETAVSAGNGAIAERVMPDAPQAALHTIHGTVRVRVRVTVDAAGNVTDAAFASAGPSRYFANIAIEAARKWVFVPGSAGTQTIAFDFRQSGVEARVE